MNFLEKLDEIQEKNKSLLCVGLDIDLSRMPPVYLNKEDPVFNFNKMIIDSTSEFVCAYKPNIAFYEALGIYGIESMIKTIEYIPDEIPVILDSKRGDIGHSAAAYAKAIFEVYKADATTVNPYLGRDCLEPFIEYRTKGIFVLCLTSNPGAKFFEKPIYKSVAIQVKEWNQYENCGLVMGATKPEELKEIRGIVGEEMPFLIPGIGAQGGDLEAAVKYSGKRSIINASRSIIYADKPGQAAKKLREEINKHRS